MIKRVVVRIYGPSGLQKTIGDCESEVFIDEMNGGLVLMRIVVVDGPNAGTSTQLKLALGAECFAMEGIESYRMYEEESHE